MFVQKARSWVKMKKRFNLRLLFGSRRTQPALGGAADEAPNVQPPPSMPLSAATNMRATRYLVGGYSKVEGWLVPTTAHIMALLAEEQTKLGIRGDLAEIGVHHGKSFLVLANSIASGEKIFAIDVFEDQHKNIDQSGHGDRETFMENVNAHAPGTPLEIIQEIQFGFAGNRLAGTPCGKHSFFFN